MIDPEELRSFTAGIALARMLSGSSFAEALFKAQLIQGMSARAGDNRQIGPEAFDALVEDLAIPLDDSGARNLALSTGCVTMGDNGNLHVKAAIDLAELFPGSLRAGVVTVTMQEILGTLGGVRNDPSQTLGVRPVHPSEWQAVIERSGRWAAEIARYSGRAGLGGIPVFWECRGSRHIPMFSDIGTTTTMDTLAMLGASCVGGGQAMLAALRSLTQDVLGMQQHTSGWVNGAFAPPGPDEDFVGAFTAEDPARGSCPTVDGSADAITALVLARRALPRRSGLLAAVDTGIANGVEFLLRQQLDPGAWTTLRYEGDTHEVEPREVSSALAVEALSWAADAGLTDRRAIDAIGRYLGWLDASAEKADEQASWAPFDPSVEWHDFSRLDATAWVAKSLLAAGTSFPDVAPRVRQLLRSAMSFLANHWDVSTPQLQPVQFRVPTWTGPKSVPMTWELPRHTMIATLIIRYAMQDGPEVALRSWSQIDSTLKRALEDERHGHWPDLLMRDRAVPANTRYNLELIQAYVSYMCTAWGPDRSGSPA